VICVMYVTVSTCLKPTYTLVPTEPQSLTQDKFTPPHMLSGDISTVTMGEKVSWLSPLHCPVHDS
jgi:hypothetical protein